MLSPLAPNRIALMPASRRLATGLFATLMLMFVLLAQANLWFQVGAGGFPGPERVLTKYHGKDASSKLHKVLDLSLPQEDPEAMWPFLGDTAEVRTQRRASILAWAEAGAPKEGWDALQPLFTGAETCGQCHAAGGQKSDLPFDTYERVKAVTLPDRGMPWGTLFISAHNHFFVFAVAALLLSVLLTFTGLTGLPRTALILAAFAGPVIDVGCWFLTKGFGAPWHFGVMLGGGLFGGAVGSMSLVVLWESFYARPERGPA